MHHGDRPTVLHRRLSPLACDHSVGHSEPATAIDAAGAGRPWRAALFAAALLILPDAAFARVPDEFLGHWSSDPARCRQANGEVDVLDVTKSSLSFYEIACELQQSTRRQDTVRIAARCYKGGSPLSSGTVILRHTAPDRIDLALQGFSWTSEKPESFRRCHAE